MPFNTGCSYTAHQHMNTVFFHQSLPGQTIALPQPSPVSALCGGAPLTLWRGRIRIPFLLKVLHYKTVGSRQSDCWGAVLTCCARHRPDSRSMRAVSQ